MADGEIVETASSVDATCQWRLRHRTDGWFDYGEYQYVDLHPDGQVEGHWERTFTSGIFATAQTARADAFETIHWLPGQL